MQSGLSSSWIVGCFVVCGLAAAACTAGSSKEKDGPTGTLRVALEASSPHDVASVRYRVVDAGQTCDAPLSDTTVPLSGDALPASAEPAGGGGAHPFAAAVILLAAGDYHVCATPLTAAGTPSAQCAEAAADATVVAGTTTEVALVSQCAGDPAGGLSATTVLNDPPAITSVLVTPGPFITTCENATIDVTASDPNGDALSFSWTLSSSPASGEFESTTATGNTGSITIHSNGPGDAVFSTNVTDVHGAVTSLATTIHIAQGDCAPDTTPPTLSAFTISPSVDTSNGPATITGSFALSDSGSGVRFAFADVVSPSGNRFANCGVNAHGSPSSVTLTCNAGLAGFGEAGAWVIQSVEYGDYAGNNVTLSTSDLQAAGLPTSVQVTSIQDTTPPTVTSLTVSPPSIDTTTKSATVHVTVSATDTQSGIEDMFVVLTDSTGFNQRFCDKDLELFPNDPRSATIACDIVFPAFGAGGTWTVSELEVSDAQGNGSFLQTSDLQAAGFKTILSVTTVQDTTPPIATAISFSPASVDTSAGPVTVTATVQVSDDLSGFAFGQLLLGTPSGAFGAFCDLAPGSGTVASTTTSCTLFIPQFAEPGAWVVSSLELFDQVNNANFDAAAGLNATLQVK